MMQVRCQNCGWLFELGQAALAQAVAAAQAKNEPQHMLSCPQCQASIQLEVAHMREQLPEDYPLPQVPAPAPPPQPAPAVPAALRLPVASAQAEDRPEASLLATNIAFIPQWNPKTKREVTQLAFRLALAGVAAAWVVVLAWLARQTIGEAEARPLPTGVDLAVVLAPVLAAAAGVERFLETIFGVIEHNWHTLVAYLGHGLRWLHNAETQVQEARKWLADMQYEASKVMQEIPTSPEQLEQIIPDYLDQGKTIDEWRAEIVANAQRQLDMANSMVALAEARMAEAERELAAAVKSTSYKNAKAAASIVLGLLLGLVVATAGQLQMFALLGVGAVPAKIDVLVTGLVIGSGSYPVHALLGVLQQAKDTLDGAQAFLKSRVS